MLPSNSPNTLQLYRAFWKKHHALQFPPTPTKWISPSERPKRLRRQQTVCHTYERNFPYYIFPQYAKRKRRRDTHLAVLLHFLLAGYLRPTFLLNSSMIVFASGGAVLSQSSRIPLVTTDSSLRNSFDGATVLMPFLLLIASWSLSS